MMLRMTIAPVLWSLFLLFEVSNFISRIIKYMRVSTRLVPIYPTIYVFEDTHILNSSHLKVTRSSSRPPPNRTPPQDLQAPQASPRKDPESDLQTPVLHKPLRLPWRPRRNRIRRWQAALHDVEVMDGTLLRLVLYAQDVHPI